MTLRRDGWARRGAVPAIVLFGAALVLAAVSPDGKRLDIAGGCLVFAGTAPLLLRLRWPVPVLVVVVAASAPYHALRYPSEALLPAVLVALYTVASTVPRRHAYVAGTAIGTIVIVVAALTGDGGAVDTAGWVFAAAAVGVAARNWRAYADEAASRAQQAEHTREEEALRRVVQERLRIARDLHDLLAHSITSIGVQTGAASHLLNTGDGADQRQMLTRTLDSITTTCHQAGAALRTALGVLRDTAEAPDATAEPVPSLARLADLTKIAETAGITAVIHSYGTPRPLAPPVEIAAYRIVQEALTNVVKHANASCARIRLDYAPDRIRVSVTDDGRGAIRSRAGYGILGMIERAQSLGGRLSTRALPGGGFAVVADLPAAAQTGDSRVDPGPAG